MSPAAGSSNGRTSPFGGEYLGSNPSPAASLVWYNGHMSRNPYLNALFAGLYIVFIVLLITYGPAFVREKPDTILAPMAMLSLFVLSAAFMSYVFFSQPVFMYLEGQKREAVELFTKTLGTFAVITGIVVIIAFTI